MRKLGMCAVCSRCIARLICQAYTWPVLMEGKDIYLPSEISWFTVVTGGNRKQSCGAGCYRRGQDRERQDSRIPSARIHQGLLILRAACVPQMDGILFAAGEEERRQELRPQQGSWHVDHGTNTRTLPAAAVLQLSSLTFAQDGSSDGSAAREDLRRE